LTQYDECWNTLPRTFGLDPDKMRGNIEEYVDIL